MFLLKILFGEMTGKVFQVSGRSATVGRGKATDIQLPDRAMSRIHLKISARGNGWVVQDLWSRNGTLLNGEALEGGKDAFVRQGDHLTIGVTSFCLAFPEAVDDLETTSVERGLISHSLDELESFPGDRPGTYARNVKLFQGFSELLMGSLGLREIFQALADYLFDVFKRVQRVAIFQKDPDTGQLIELIVRIRSGINADENVYSRSIAEEVFLSGEPQFTIEFDEQNKSRLSDSRQAVRSYMCVPLISRPEVQGVIYVDSLEHSNGFRHEDVFLISALSSSAAMAIENATLITKLEQKLDTKTRALQQIGNQLQQSEVRYKVIFNNMKIGAMVLKKAQGSDDFQILEMNEAALRIEGVEEKTRILGSPVSKALPFVVPCGLMTIFYRVCRTGKPESAIITIPDGTGFPLYRDCYLYSLSSDELVLLYEDVTNKVIRDKEQKELQIQLFNSQKMESIGLIAGGVAHNFRNILQAVYGNIEYLEMLYKDHPEIFKIAKSIEESVEKGTELINDLLHFSRRSHEAEFSDYVDLCDLIEKTCNIISRVLDQRITIDLKLEHDIKVKGSSSLLSQVFMNLLTNARDAIDGEGRILLETMLQNGRVVCRVSDTGIGMDQDTLERLFDPFFTLKEVGKGTGLGLSTSRGIIEQHGGEITVASSPGVGSTFEITMPLVNTLTHVESEPVPLNVMGNAEKILIVDDDEAVLKSMSLLVERLGYRPTIAHRATEALKRYTFLNPDLVIIDRNMPEMDGLSCIQEMIRLDPNAKVVILSGYNDIGPDGIDDDIRQVICGYLTKPCRIHELAHTIEQALGA